MSGLLHEERLDNTIASGRIGLHEVVEVRTKMGEHVTYGEVISATPWGIVVRNENKSANFYPDRLYLFAVIEPEVEEVAATLLTDKSPDSRVEAKLAQMEQSGATQPGSKGKTSGSTIIPDDEDEEDGQEDGEVKKEKDEPKDDEKPPVAKTTSAIDPEKLPADIKKAILSSKQMDSEQLNSVLGEVSDAAMKALKRTGIRETEIFSLIHKIQLQVYRVLTGEPAPPPAPKKKNGDKK